FRTSIKLSFKLEYQAAKQESNIRAVKKARKKGETEHERKEK
ncbi:hypothetical protein A2U01_0099243, partial [Trifolium medium]|nr:hypothetical protein [Trifolium medium]